MKQVNLVLLVIFCISINSCQKDYSTKEVDWLLGTWENQTEDGTFTETWIKTKNETKEELTYDRLEAKSTLIKNSDTLFYEEVILFKMDKWIYSVMASAQNEGKATLFTATLIGKNELVFENIEHDFPKKITYKLVNKDSLFAEISGDGNRQGFPFKRVR